MCIPMKLCPLFNITAIGIHINSSNKPLKSNWVNALNSFILSVREVDVSQALSRGLSPYGVNSSRLSGSSCQSANLSFNVKTSVLLLPLDYISHRLSITVKSRLKPNAVFPLTGLRERCILSYEI